MLLGEIMRYGALSDAALIEPLRQLYSWFVDGGMPAALRFEVYQCATGLQHLPDFPVNTFLPFVACDPTPAICSRAVIDFVSIAQLTDGDPMSRVRDIIGIMADPRIANRGAVFAGLLYLGDPRVCALLMPLRDALTKDEVRDAVLSHTEFVHASTTEFLIDWLEGMEGDHSDSMFAFVAAALSRTRRITKLLSVMTGERPFPVYSVTQERQREMARLIPIEEYTQRIAPRLRALERTEPEPKVMPDVLAAWGISASQVGTPAIAGIEQRRLMGPNASWLSERGRVNGSGPSLIRTDPPLIVLMMAAANCSSGGFTSSAGTRAHLPR
jgi:hypothetical protein